MPRFTTTIELGGKTATGFEVPERIVDELGSGRRPKVRVTLGGHTYASTVAAMGGRFMVPLSAENRAAAGLAADDVVEVELVLDDAPRTVDVPGDLGAALADAGVREAFDALSYTARKEYARQVSDAKKPETRERRIAKAVSDLSG